MSDVEMRRLFGARGPKPAAESLSVARAADDPRFGSAEITLAGESGAGLIYVPPGTYTPNAAYWGMMPTFGSSFEIPDFVPAAGKGAVLRCITQTGYHKDGLKDCTVDAGTDIVTCAGHGFVSGQRVIFGSRNGALPGGLVGSATAASYVLASNLTANTFQVSATYGGSVFNFSSAGTQVVVAPMTPVSQFKPVLALFDSDPGILHSDAFWPDDSDLGAIFYPHFTAFPTTMMVTLRGSYLYGEVNFPQGMRVRPPSGTSIWGAYAITPNGTGGVWTAGDRIKLRLTWEYE